MQERGKPARFLLGRPWRIWPLAAGGIMSGLKRLIVEAAQRPWRVSAATVIGGQVEAGELPKGLWAVGRLHLDRRAKGPGRPSGRDPNPTFERLP